MVIVDFRNGSRPAVAGRLIAQPVYRQLRKYPTHSGIYASCQQRTSCATTKTSALARDFCAVLSKIEHVEFGSGAILGSWPQNAICLHVKSPPHYLTVCCFDSTRQFGGGMVITLSGTSSVKRMSPGRSPMSSQQRRFGSRSSSGSSLNSAAALTSFSDSIYSAGDDIAALARCRDKTKDMGISVVESARDKHDLHMKLLYATSLKEAIELLRQQLVKYKATLSSPRPRPRAGGLARSA